MKQVEWNGVAVNSATQVTFKWNVVQNRKIIEGYHLYVWRVEGVEEEEKGLKVKDDKESDENIAGGQTENKEIITLSGGGTTSYTMKNLSPYTRYQAFILPFAKTAFGRPSVIISFTTKETVPVLPPSRLELKLVESSSAVASWKPPAEESIGGKLIGYKVEILTNGSQVGNLTLDPGSTSLMLNNLSSGYTYTLRIAAFNGAGVGPYSDEVTLKVEPSLLFSPALAPSGGFSRSIHETWFVSFIGTFSILSVLAAGFLVYIRRRSAARKHYAQYSVGESKTDNNSLTCMESDTLWINPKATGLSMYGSYHEKPTHLYINSVYPPEYAELQQTNQKINQGPTDKTFQDSNYLPQGPCYASTDLMEQSFNKTNGSGEERSSGEEQSQSTGETTSGSLSSRGKASVERREKPRRIKKSSHETSQQSVQCDGLISAFQQRQMLCYSVGNSPYRVYNRGLTAESGPLPLCDPGLPPMPPSRGPSSFQGVRVGSLNSFNGPSPGAIRYGSNFSVPGLVPGYPEYGGMLGRVYRVQEERGFDSQYESASIYQATHPTLNTANREESSLINHPNNICNIPTSTANSNNHYMSCGSEHSEMESFYADSSFEDTQTHHPVSNGVLTPSQPGVLAQEEQIYSTFKPPPLHNERVPKRRLRMERRLSDSQSRKLKRSIISLQERGSVSANCSPAPNRRCREEGIVHLSTRVSEDINEMVEQIQSIQNDISELAGRPISLTK
ncbi:uncharacterized protein LOC111714717 [Eurytemora carolleeae]|uniref:uncharacterized protein LOC111714717 n=1 Tax=Eurytemora carolleeae TaxID=1294199 RepID=UPI000C77B436|nr:uncharacterized protein LOC111714717 [Eurytemora carolleeae]|eukprot:XP_023345645.1 uncharacterized protein LOC111714717 [Eurytemora affinis]